MKNGSDILAGVLRKHEQEVREALNQTPDWPRAARRFDTLFSRMVNPKDSLWSRTTVEKLTSVYLAGRGDYQSNTTLRTVSAMPAGLHNDTKKIFIQMAEVCCVFNASHKVNFDANELPEDFVEVPMTPTKRKGFFTYAAPLPALYSKTSLTFDYWVLKILEWVGEIRREGLSAWRGIAILKHESCTDFMRIALLFLSDPIASPPLAKGEDRQALLERVFGESFVWIKKFQKREDILKNNRAIVEGLNRSAASAGLKIPLEAWSRLLPLAFVKGLLTNSPKISNRKTRDFLSTGRIAASASDHGGIYVRFRISYPTRTLTGGHSRFGVLHAKCGRRSAVRNEQTT